MSEMLARSRPLVSCAMAIHEFVVKTVEHHMACGPRLRRRLVFMAAFKAGESRVCPVVGLARETVGGGGPGDE